MQHKSSGVIVEYLLVLLHEVIVAILWFAECFHAIPADMGVAFGAFHMVTSAVLLNSHLAGRTCLNAQLAQVFFQIVFVLPFLTSIVGMRWFTFETLRVPTDLTVDFFSLIDFLLTKDVLTMITGHILTTILAYVARDFYVANLLKLFLGEQ